MSAAAVLLVIRESAASGLSYGGRSAADRSDRSAADRSGPLAGDRSACDRPAEQLAAGPSGEAGTASDAAAAGRVIAHQAAAEERVDSPPFSASHASDAPGEVVSNGLGTEGSSGAPCAKASSNAPGAEATRNAPGAEETRNAPGAETRSSAPDPHDPHTPPADDDDTLFELEEEIATLSAHIAAATHELLSMIAEFDRRGGWKIGGHRSCAHWLHFRTGVDMGTAREKVRTARALQSLPKTSEEMAKGSLTFSQARALTRAATPESEEELLEAARSLTVSDLERFLRSWRVLSRKDEAELERERYRSRTFSVYPDEMGMYEVRGKLPAEVGAVLMRAIEAAGDALFTQESASETTAKQRRADAIGLLAERALAAGFGGSGLGRGSGTGSRGVSGNVIGHVSGNVIGSVSAETPRSDRMDGAREHPSEHGSRNASHETPGRGEPLDAGETPTPGAGRPDTPTGMPEEAEHSAKGLSENASYETPESLHETSECPNCAPGEGTEVPISGSRAERYQVLLHVEAAALLDEEAAAAPRSHFEDGTRASYETSRRLTCDASVVKMGRGTNGEVLDVGRKTRTVPPAIRRALEVRDGGCTFPGCGLRFAEAHHVKHWADGGETKLDNLILLCRYHHRLLHEEGWSVVYRGGTSGSESGSGTSTSATGAGAASADAARAGRTERPSPPVFFDPHGHARSSARPRSRSALGMGRRTGIGDRTGLKMGQCTGLGTAPGTAPGTGPRAEALLSRRNGQRGIEPDGSELAPRYASERDVPLPILERAFEALADAMSRSR